MRHQVVHNRGHGFPKDLSLQGCTTLPTRANRLLMPQVTSSFGGRQRVEGYTLFMRKSIHDSSGNCYQPLTLGRARIAAPSSSFQHHFQFKSSHSHPNGNSQTRGPMDRCAHASSFVRIAHTLQRVVCTLSLGSKSRTTVLGSARQNKAPQSRWPSIHASLSFHLMFSLSSSAAPFHLQYFRNQLFTSGDNSPTIYNSS